MKITKKYILKDYSLGNNNPKTFYGLPKDIKFFSKCTYSNQKPN